MLVTIPWFPWTLKATIFCPDSIRPGGSEVGVVRLWYRPVLGESEGMLPPENFEEIKALRAIFLHFDRKVVRTCRISSAGPATAGQSSTVPKYISSCLLTDVALHISLQAAKYNNNVDNLSLQSNGKWFPLCRSITESGWFGSSRGGCMDDWDQAWFWQPSRFRP